MTRRLAVAGNTLTVGGNVLGLEELFFDDFTRADGAVGNGWTDLSVADSTQFNPLGIVSHRLVVSDPMSRPQPPGSTIDNDSGPINTRYIPGIGGIHRDLGVAGCTVTVQYGPDTNGHTLETAPATNFVPGAGNTLQCIGAWPIALGTAGILTISGLGRPPECFGDATLDPLLALAFFNHDTGPHSISMTSSGTQITAVTFDGVSLIMRSLMPGNAPLPGNVVDIPAALQGSTRHGICLDTHLEIPHITPSSPLCSWVRITS